MLDEMQNQWCEYFYLLVDFLEYIRSHRHILLNLLSLDRETYMKQCAKLQMRSKLIVDVGTAILKQQLL
jgi:hypothetical protein